MVKLPEKVTQRVNQTWRFNDDFTITHYNRELRQVAPSYTLQSFVLYRGENHFVYRRFESLENGQRELYDFDNLGRAEVRSWRTEDPFYETAPTTCVYMAVYRRLD